MTMRISTNFKLFLASIGCLVLLVVVAATANSTTTQLLDVLEFVADGHEFLGTLENSRMALERAETVAYEKSTTASSAEYRQAVAVARMGLVQLRVLSKGAQKQSVDHLSLAAERRIAALDQLISARQSGDPNATDDGLPFVQTIEIIVDQLRTEEHLLLIQRSDNAEASSSFALIVVSVLTFLGCGYVVLSAVLIRRDILRREQSERALRSAERKIRSIFENAPIGIFESTPDGKYMRANATMAEILGYDSPEELLHARNELNKQFYVDPEVRTHLAKRLKSDGVIRDYETEWYRKDGSTVWVTGNGRLVQEDNGDSHFEAMVYDITERKRTQQQLSYVKSQLEFVLNSATAISIIAVDVTGKITIFNPGAEQMLGYSGKEMIGESWSLFHYEPEIEERRAALSGVLGKQLSRFDLLVENVREGGHEIREWTYVRKDGVRLTVSLTVSGVRNAQGELIGFLCIGRDVTERKRAEQERHQLERQLRRKNLELERETKRALDASRMKSEFLANMSHELRTPLNGIIGFAEMMHDEVVGPISDEHKEYLSDILVSARHLLQLINDILDLSKVEAGKMDFLPEDLNLKTVIGEVQAILKTLSQKKKLVIETDMDEAIEKVFLDPRKLKQVLYNYLSNAIKFTPEGGKVSLRTRPDREGMFRIEVEDTGIGIKMEDLKQLFVEFKQLDSSRGKRYQGTGLGLALTKRIAEAQGGRVGVESMPGKGSTFYVILPLVGTVIRGPDDRSAAVDAAMEAQVQDSEVVTG